MGFEDFKKEAQNKRNVVLSNIAMGPDHVKPQAEVKEELNYAKDLINQITYEVPEGMTEEEAMAIALGAMLDDELLKNSATSSSPGLDKEKFKRTYMLVNGFLGKEARANEFYYVMPRARELARLAFEKFKNGDRSDVERYARNTMLTAKDNAESSVTMSSQSNILGFVCKCACTLYDNGYVQDIDVSPLAWNKIRRTAAAQELCNEAVIQTARLAEHFPAPNSAEREEALLNIMAANTLAVSTPVSDQVINMIWEVGHEVFPNEMAGSGDIARVIRVEAQRVADGIKKNTLYLEEYMTADPQRRQNYLAAIKEYLRTTDNFKTLLAADPEDFARQFDRLSTVRLTEDKQYELVGEENIEAVNEINRSNADKQFEFLENFMQHAKENAEQKVREAEAAKKAKEEKVAKHSENIKKTLLAYVKETQGLGDQAEKVSFFYSTGGRSGLDSAVENIIKGGNVYLKNPSNGRLMEFSPKYNEDGTISVEQRETTAYRYPGSQPIKNIFVIQNNLKLAQEMTPPHEVGGMPEMERLFLYKRQLADAAYGLDMGADYRTVIDAIEEAEQYYKGLYTPGEDGRYPVFGIGDKEGLQRVFDSVLQAVSEYQNTNPSGLVMDNVKAAVHAGQKYVNELQVENKNLSLKALVSIQETKDLDAMMVGRTYTKEQSELEARKQLGEYLSQLETLTNGKELSENYQNYITSLKSLINTTDLYFVPNGKEGYPAITVDDKKKILEQYGTAIGSTDRLIRELKAGSVEETAKLREMVEMTREFLAADIQTVEDLVADGKTNLPDAIYNGRGQKAVLPQGVELNTLGGHMSSRIAMTYTDAVGVEHKGFFTRNYTYNARKEFEDAAGKIGDKYPELKEYFNAIKNYHQDIEIARCPIRYLCTSPETLASDSDLLGYKKGAFSDFANHKDFSAACQEFSQMTSKLSSHLQLEELNGISKEGTVPSRNTALSRMATLLGVPEIVAGSREMTFVQDGVEYKGHFMDAASGVDLESVREGDPMTMYGEEVYDNGEGLRKMSELQVLDYICGNTDRHQSNFMYNFDTTDPEHPKFTGPVGIDNDLSFGSLVPSPGRKMGLNGICLNSINAISKSMADTIQALQPEMIELTLQDMGISNEEIAGCVGRLIQVQERIQEGLAREWSSDIEIRQGTLHVIPDADFDRLKLKDLVVQTINADERNLFSFLQSATLNARYKASENEKSDLEKEKKTRDVPRDISQKEKEFFAKTERADVYSKSTYEDYGKQFKEMYDRLSETEGFFHGSKQQYKDMKRALEQLVQAGEEEPDTAYYQTLLNNMRDTVQSYLDYKKDDLGSSTSQRRFEIANELKNLTGTIRSSYFDALEIQNERDRITANREMEEALRAEEQPLAPELSEQLRSISDSLREKLAPANERMKEVLEMRKEERGQLERMIKESPDIEQYAQTLIKVKRNEATEREKTVMDGFQKLYNDKFVKHTIAHQKEGINKGLQGDMLKYAATVQKIAKSLDQMIPNEVQGARAELASKLHDFAGKRHPNSIDTCAFITGLKETIQVHQTELADSADPVYRQITELVTNHDSHFGDLDLAETEQYMIDGRHLEASNLGTYISEAQKLRDQLIPAAPEQAPKQVEADKSGPMA